ncbi:MAG: hypothetical protein WBE68_24530, partial [Candidatus Nitrosopolaris sp.]
MKGEHTVACFEFKKFLPLKEKKYYDNVLAIEEKGERLWKILSIKVCNVLISGNENLRLSVLFFI